MNTRFTYALMLVLAGAGCSDEEVLVVPPADTNPPEDSALVDTGVAPDTAVEPDTADTSVADTTPATDTAPAPKTVSVTVGEGGAFAFNPPDVMINVGDTIRWTWGSGGHSVVSGTGCVPDGKFCDSTDTECSTAPILLAGATYSHTFTAAGTFPYFCMPHCTLGMVGNVTVMP